MIDKNEIKRIENTLDTLENGFKKRAVSLFSSILDELKAIVSRVLRNKKISDKFELSGKKRYFSLFERYVRECFLQGMIVADDEIKKMRRKFASNVTAEAVIPEEAVRWMDKWTEKFGEDYYGDLTEDVVKVLKTSLENGYSVGEVMIELEKYFGSNNFSRLEVIARTNATTAFNQGRVEMFRQNSDFVPAVQFLSILDARTTDICLERNGKIMLLDSPELAENTPPLHYQCRSILSPINVYEWDEIKNDKNISSQMNWKGLPDPEKGFGILNI